MKGSGRPKMSSMIATSALALMALSHLPGGAHKGQQQFVGHQHTGRRGKATKKKRGKR